MWVKYANEKETFKEHCTLWHKAYRKIVKYKIRSKSINIKEEKEKRTSVQNPSRSNENEKKIRKEAGERARRYKWMFICVRVCECVYNTIIFGDCGSCFHWNYSDI